MAATFCPGCDFYDAPGVDVCFLCDGPMRIVQSRPLVNTAPQMLVASSFGPDLPGADRLTERSRLSQHRSVD